MDCTASQTVETDVLVIGGGCAGCWAALSARQLGKRVTLVDKGVVARSGDMLYCHNTIAPMPEEELEGWLEDWVRHTEYLSDQASLEVLLRENGHRLAELEAWGAPFERDAQGNIVRGLGRGHVVSRVVYYDGRLLMEVMKERLKELGVDIRERIMATDLITSDGHYPTRERVVGALGLHTRNGRYFVFKAKAVVVATGLFGAKLHFAFADNLTGDAQAMAFRVGAELTDLEFSFSPDFTAYKDGVILGISLIQFQTLGAYLVNRSGERFMKKYAPERLERRSSIGTLVQAISKEIMEGRGPVYFDMRHLGAEGLALTRRIIPVTVIALETANIDLANEMVEVRPLVPMLGGHGSGGIRINIDGQTNVPGLLAAGICSKFPGCSEVLSGGFVAMCNVVGYRAGQRAADFADRVEEFPLNEGHLNKLRDELLAPLSRADGLAPEEVYFRLNKMLVRPEYSIIKTEEKIDEIIEEIRRTAREDLHRIRAKDVHQLVKANEARNFVQLLEPVYICARERKESRLSHYRKDYPFRDDADWLKWVVVKKEDGLISVRHEPIPLKANRIKLEERRRIPAPIQFS
ncbi:MAG: FAD-binding protein [Thermodesulfobacteriota bacterium]